MEQQRRDEAELKGEIYSPIVAQGVNELDSDKLPRLLELRYASVSEGAQTLGGVPVVREAFIECQRGLFERLSTVTG